MPSNDRIHRLDIVRHCCRPPGPVSRIRAAATTALHNRPINRQTWCFLSTITIGAYYEDDGHDDHDDGDLRVSRASAVVQWQRGNRYICYRILNVPIRWVLYLFWRFFVSGISPPVRMTNNAYVIYRVVTFARACMFSIFTVNRALFRCFLSPHHAHSSIARPLSRKFVFQKLTSVFKSLCGALHSFFFAFRRFNGRRLLAD